MAELPKEAGFLRRIGLLTSDSVTPAPLSRDGRLIAIPVDTRPFMVARYRVIETSTGRLIREVGYDNQRMTDCIFLPDGRQFLTCSLVPASTQFIFRLWNLATGQETVLDQIENPGFWPSNLCLSDDGKRLGMSLGAADKRTPEVRIVDLESGSVLLKIPCAHTQEGNARDDPALAGWQARDDCDTCGTKTRSVNGRMGSFASTTVEGETPPRLIELTNYCWDPFYSRETAEFGTMCSRKGEGLWVEYWSADSGASVRRISLGANDAAYYALASSGTRAAVKDSENPDSDNRIHVYDLPAGTDVFQTKPFAFHERISLSDDGRLLAIKQSGEMWLYRLPDPPAADK